jgi:uncharacterized membrane protein
VTDWVLVYLAIVTTAIVATTIAQIVIGRSALRLARTADETAREIRRDLAPLLEKANRIADTASQAAALALTQMERIDRVVLTTTRQVEETVATVQQAVVGPVRQAAGLVAAVRAFAAAFRQTPGGSAARGEDEALFVG